MLAIRVKFHNATDTQGSRLRASAANQHATMGFHALPHEPWKEVVLMLLKKLEWTGHWVGGHLDDGSMVFVCYRESNNPRVY